MKQVNNLTQEIILRSSFNMPIYEYKCLKCEIIFEELQSFSDPDLTKCPHCKNGKVEKLISLSSFQLKGDGWYSTDYAKKTKAVHTAPPSDGMDATKQSIDSASGKKDNKSVADSISKDVNKARGKK